ncbi:MAG: hypothetical protein WA655_12490 [Candidatus Korobacteraceae bacterium]
MKIAVRVLVFAAGASLFFFGWYKAHSYTVDLSNPSATSSVNGFEVMVVIGALLALMAFAPSPETLGRWMSLKRPRRPQPAHFRRRRRT